jgi:hypothetical protein
LRHKSELIVVVIWSQCHQEESVMRWFRKLVRQCYEFIRKTSLTFFEDRGRNFLQPRSCIEITNDGNGEVESGPSDSSSSVQKGETLFDVFLRQEGDEHTHIRNMIVRSAGHAEFEYKRFAPTLISAKIHTSASKIVGK